MRQNRRWIAAIKTDADTLPVALPWTRGARRAAWIAKRAAADRPVPRRAASA